MSAAQDLKRAAARGTTRRTIVATGAKATYAAPLLAASIALSASGAAAASPLTQQLLVPALHPNGVDLDVSGALEVCISATGNALLCLGDAGRSFCPVTPPGTNAVCPGGSACCGSYLCGELLARLDGGAVIEIGAGPTCLDTSAASTLSLFIFDSYYPDNSGEYTVTVTKS